MERRRQPLAVEAAQRSRGVPDGRHGRARGYPGQTIGYRETLTMPTNVPLAGVILAAGKGTRMISDLPKCLHSVCGIPMVEHIGRAMRAVGVRRPILVIGHRGDLLRAALGEEHYAYAYQMEQLGTGHAALMAREHLESHDGPVIVAPGDTPLLNEDALRQLVERHLATKAQATVATVLMDDPRGYGRLVRDADGRPRAIVEDRDATPEQRHIREINSAVYCFDAKTLFRLLPKIGNTNAQGEFYLTDVLARIGEEAKTIEAVTFPDPRIFQGVNDRWQLAEAAADMRRIILRRLALSGVTIVDPSSTFIGADVEIAPDTCIEPMTTIQGKSVIGPGCVIGPMSNLLDAEVGAECVVLMSSVNGARLLEGSRCGPYAHVRPGSVIGPRAKVGNFVEVKNAEMGEGVAASHLSYIGDATIGPRTNIGAGTITCNYDGFAKHRTTIGEEAFIGSNTTLIAPIQIGDRSIVAAGSVVTRDVASDSLAIARAKQEEKQEWAIQWRRRKQAERP